MNGLALQSRLEKNGISAILQTAIKMEPVTEQYSRRKAVEYLDQGKVVIFGSGTGNPYFTTDTAAALRAAEINADAILVGKTIDGVYSDDPKINPTAVKYDHITYSDILNQDLKVMDLIFSDAEPGRGAAVSGAFFLAWQVCAGHSDARAFFSEISQKNFENPLCKMQKMVYNDL